MKGLRLALGVVLTLAMVHIVRAADEPELKMAQGKVLLATKEKISFQPREDKGKFGKAIDLTVTGTSKISAVLLRKMGTRTVVAQKDIGAQDLQKNQMIAVTYVTVGGSNVVLSVVVPPSK